MSIERLGRRAFLRGAGGVVVGLPFLNMFAGKASAQAARPLRVVIMFHPQGTLLSQWKPPSGALTTLPPLLAPLDAFKTKMNVLTGVDNVIRNTMKNSNGHNGAARSILTCQPFVGVRQGQQPDNAAADGPSFDWVLGPKIKGDAPRPVVNLGVNTGPLDENTVFWKASGQSAGIDDDPRTVIDKLFSSVGTSPTPPPKPTPEEIFRKRRGSVLDTVLGSFNELRGRAPAEDKARLDAHADQIRALEMLASGGAAGGSVVAACAKPDLTGKLPSGYNPQNDTYDDSSSAAQVENAVMALACDVTRCVTLQYKKYTDPRFPWLFNGDRGAVIRGNTTYTDWHAMVHTAAGANDSKGVANLAAGFTWYMSQAAQLCKRLSQIEDGPGQTLLDNTLVLTISEFGNGGAHFTTDIPVVLVGDVGKRLKTGQSRDVHGHTTGDVFTTIQQAFTGDATKFGMTGNITDQSGNGQPPRDAHAGQLTELLA